MKNVTIYSGTTYTASNGATTDISGTIAGKGTIQVNGGGGTNGFLNLTGATTLSGGGVVSLTTATGGDSAIVEGSRETLTNASDVIEGTGTIGNGSLALINGGTIDANSSSGTETLILNGTGGITNADGGAGGLLEATSGGTLEIDGITVDNAGGAITADGGTVKLISATIQGGTLNVLGGGTMETVSSATLDGKTHGALTISAGSTYTASNGATTDILGTITDKGTIQLNGGGGTNGFLDLTGATTLNGGGVVSMTTKSEHTPSINATINIAVMFRYTLQDPPALNHVNATIEAGEIVALVGPSGAGKTTIVNLVPRFYQPQEGRVLLDGLDIATVRLSELRAAIAIVP